MRCDGRTFTETNGNIVSGKADRAVNRGPNTEQINISRNSFVFSDRLGARQQMHQTLSGHFSPQMSQKTSWRQRAPSAGHRPWTLTSELDPLLRGCCFGSWGQTSPGLSFQPRYRPSWDLFRDVFGWAEYSNEAIFATQPNQLKTQRGQSAFYEFSLDGRPPKGFSPQPCSCAVNGLVVQGQLLKPMTVMYSCHSKASISDSHTVHHRTPHWTGSGHMWAMRNLEQQRGRAA